MAETLVRGKPDGTRANRVQNPLKEDGRNQRGNAGSGDNFKKRQSSLGRPLTEKEIKGPKVRGRASAAVGRYGGVNPSSGKHLYAPGPRAIQ